METWCLIPSHMLVVCGLFWFLQYWWNLFVRFRCDDKESWVFWGYHNYWYRLSDTYMKNDYFELKTDDELMIYKKDIIILKQIHECVQLANKNIFK